MALTVLVGGARSGKSRLAVDLARGSGVPVTLIATAEPLDEEMVDRIRRHRAARPRTWGTIEAPLELAGALTQQPGEVCLVVDCLTLWISNLVHRGVGDDQIQVRAAEAAALAARRPGPTIAVTNEVGSGIVPTNALARRYADSLGQVNATWVDAAARSFLVVAGRVVPLGTSAPILEP
jgi:adenosylcobinamide kinase / adenosylcobinamide-phosphate guanylyltransferase